jgi:F-type H+-transporting ATPase subunit b
MDLLTPSFGLLFWMTLSFGVVFFILAKFGFPVIVRMVDERKKYIDDSVSSAEEANRQLAEVKAESERLMLAAREQESALLREAAGNRDRILAEAREAARGETARMLEDSRRQMRLEKEAALAEIRSQVALLAVDIAEKVLRGELRDKGTQMELAGRLLDEVRDQKLES